MSDVQVKGLSELQKALDTLPTKIQNNIMRGALRAGSKLIKNEAAARVPVESGLLSSSLRISTRNRDGKVQASVSVGGATKKGAIIARHAHLVEFGTKPHIIEAKPGKTLAIGVSRVNHPGSKPQPFMRPALDLTQSAAITAVGEYIRTRLATKHGLDVPAPLEEGDET